jgi:colanic acid/amylovoran biosynthesis glycosyltransferase
MKIAFIVDQFPAISETFIMNQITGLIDSGHEVNIFADSSRQEDKVHQQVYEYQLLRRTYYFNKTKTKRPRLLRLILFLLRNFYKNPWKITRSFIVAKRLKIGRLRACYYMVPFLGKSFEIAHCQYGTNGLIGIFLKEINIVGKVVVTFHGYDLGPSVKRKPDMYDLVFKKADIITANSEYTKKKLINIGCIPDKIKILKMGIAIGEYPFSERKLIDNSKVRILTVARLVEKKGLEYSIKAVVKLLGKGYNVQYIIAGDGPFKRHLENLISELKADGQIKLLGWREASEVKRLYGRAHIFVLSSISVQDGMDEAQGLVVQEAQAMGLPVVATRLGGLPEGLLDGLSGLLVPERDVDTLAERLEYLIEHPELWYKMGKAGRQFVEEHFDIRKQNERLVNVYKDLLA